MTEQLQIDEPPRQVPAGPGERLRAAREARKWTVGNVAAQLHLDPRQVTALEADDYAHLPEPIYVSGYLRSYARLLNLSDREVIAAYRRSQTPEAPPLTPLRPVRRDPAVAQSIFQWGAVAAVGAGLLLVGWHMHAAPTALPSGKGAVGPVAAAPAAAPSVHADGGAVSTALAAEEPPAAATRDAAALPGRWHPAAAVPRSLKVSAAAPNAAGADDPGPSPAAMDGAVLRLRFSDDSWVEIEDADGQRVFYDMGEPGQTRTVHGTPPFKVLLGYSPGVSIEYNGTPFDQSPFTGRNNVAHFTVGG